MRKMIAACVLIIGSTAMAGEFTATGEGHVGANPDFIDVIVRVASQCYATVSEASAANTDLATKISKAMSGVAAQNGKDEVLVDQGVTQKQTISEYDRDTGKQTKICEGWSASSSVELRMADLKAWPALQDNLSKLIDAAAAGADQKGAKTIAAISKVEPKLYPENAKENSNKAYVMALEDARSKIMLTLATYKLCFGGYKGITADAGYAIPYSAGRSESAPAPAPGGSAQGVELSLGLQYTHSSVTVTYDMVACAPPQ